MQPIENLKPLGRALYKALQFLFYLENQTKSFRLKLANSYVFRNTYSDHRDDRELIWTSRVEVLLLSF